MKDFANMIVIDLIRLQFEVDLLHRLFFVQRILVLGIRRRRLCGLNYGSIR